MLHVTNGSVALSRIHDLGLPGDVVPWDDVLHEGPVPGGLAPARLRRVRAEFLAIDWGDVAAIEQSLTDRDRALAAGVAGDEVVLWFEHDLYDQLQVLQVLDQVIEARRPLGRPGASVTAILADDYLSAQPDAVLRAWFEARRPLAPAAWEAATEAWAAYRAAGPGRLTTFAHPGAWSTLVTALRRHLQQYPSVHTGLSRTEGQTLAALASSPLSVREAFRAANHAVEDAVFMGDAAWWWHIRPLLTGPRALVRVEGEVPPGWHHPDWWRDDDDAVRLALTDDGERVVAGEADHVALNGIDRWLGGVHLVSAPGDRNPIWRRDESSGTIVLP